MLKQAEIIKQYLFIYTQSIIIDLVWKMKNRINFDNKPEGNSYFVCILIKWFVFVMDVAIVI